MTDSQIQKPYIFNNLVHATAKSAEQLGARVTMADQPECFSSSNAKGVIANLSFDQVGTRASQFGARCRDLFKVNSSSMA